MANNLCQLVCIKGVSSSNFSKMAWNSRSCSKGQVCFEDMPGFPQRLSLDIFDLVCEVFRLSAHFSPLTVNITLSVRLVLFLLS